MQTFLIVVHVFLCALLVLLVLIQSGKGAEVSASLSGSSQTVLGASGGSNFFTKLTSIVAMVFMVTSILLTIAANRSRKSVVEGMAAIPVAATTAANAAPSVAPTVMPTAAPTKK